MISGSWQGAAGTAPYDQGRQMWTDSLIGKAPAGAALIMSSIILVSDSRTFAYSILPVAGTIWKLYPTALQVGATMAF